MVAPDVGCADIVETDCEVEAVELGELKVGSEVDAGTVEEDDELVPFPPLAAR